MIVHSTSLLPSWHPATHGGIAINYQSESGVISAAKVEIGFMHRGAEKLFEYRDYRQGAMLANRHSWTSPTAGEYSYVLAAEEMLGLKVSPRADALRAFYCEIDRVISHLTFLKFLGPLPVREEWADFMEGVTGARMHHQVIRIGGVSYGLENEHLAQVDRLTSKTLDQIANLEVSGEGVGVLDSVKVHAHGATGPIARASGVLWDERMRGYGWYEQFVPVVGSAGDAAARFSLLIEEIKQSIELLQKSLKSVMNDDELLVRTPKTIRLPEGSVFADVEGALGSTGVALFSAGGKSPDRLRLRTPSLGNLSALEAALVGLRETDLPLMLASWPFLAGDSDR